MTKDLFIHKAVENLANLALTKVREHVTKQPDRSQAEQIVRDAATLVGNAFTDLNRIADALERIATIYEQNNDAT